MSQKTDQYHHGDLRAALLSAAADMIAEQGVENVSMRRLAQVVNVSRTAPYRHFEDKAALLAAVAEEGVNRLSVAMQEAIADYTGDAVGALHAMCIAYVEFAVQNPTHYRLMFGQAQFNPTNYPALNTASAALFGEVMHVVRRGQEEGRLKPDAATHLSHTVWALVHGLAFLIIDGRHHKNAEIQELTDNTVRTLLEGMLI